MSAVDLDDTAGCPVGLRCTVCGTGERRLAVATAYTRLGVMCLTICGPCAIAGLIPPLPVGGAARAVGEHAGHLGIDLDKVVEAMEAGR